LQKLVEDNITYADESEREYILETLDKELKQSKARVYINPIPATVMINKAMLSAVFPRSRVNLLDKIIAKTNIETGTNYSEKIDALYNNMEEGKVTSQQLSLWVKEINLATDSQPVEEKKLRQ
jgi:hypothetical protein